MPLLLKLETKSSHVCGISLHRKRPWVLASLENGIIQHWDYKISSILWQHEGHDGAVRGICFHNDDPIFVSGGDDKILKVWNVEDRKCISVLRGHCDIIRSCSFHPKFPCVISSSNDRTIMIWNWITGNCISKLIGHHMEVTDAIFHPTSSVVFSSSKDGSIRLWDISKLEKKKGCGVDQIGPFATYSDKYVDPNKKGFNHIAFHEERSYLIAGNDENVINLLIYTEKNGTKELFNWRNFDGHDNIVNSVAFHPHYNFLIGCSDDKSIRILVVASRECIDVLRYKNATFGALVAHPSSCLFAAGHENGMILFKNRSERPLFCVHDGFAYYIKETPLVWFARHEDNDENEGENVTKIKNSEFRRLDLITNKDDPIQKLDVNLYSVVRSSLSFNSEENSLIFASRTNDGKTFNFHLHKLHSESDGDCISDCAESSWKRVFWIERKQFVVLNEAQKIEIRDLSNAIICELDIRADDMFYAGTGIILLKIEEEYKLFDIEKKTVTASVELKDEVRYVIWSKSEEYAAFLTKKKVILLNRKLEILCIQEESNNLKSGCWIDESVFVYNTRYQLKYALTIGDSGIIKTLNFDKQLYIFDARGENVCCFDRDANIVEVPVESSEYKFKIALFNGRIDEGIQLLESENSKFVGQSMIAVLAKYGYPEISLTFIKDDRTRFLLAQEIGNLEKALEYAERLNVDIAWTTLAEAALFQGNHEIAEICYQKSRNYEKLSFLYFVTGSTKKLKDLTTVIDDPNVQFQISLLIGDIGERIRVLKRCDQISLAYLAAVTHGYDNEVEELKKELEFKKRPIPKTFSNARFLTPLRPVHRLMDNWPVVKLTVSLDDAGLGSSHTCGNVCESETAIEKRTVENLEESSKENDGCGEILDDESNNVSLGGDRDRESSTLPNSPGSCNEETGIRSRSPPTSSTHSPSALSTSEIVVNNCCFQFKLIT